MKRKRSISPQSSRGYYRPNKKQKIDNDVGGRRRKREKSGKFVWKKNKRKVDSRTQRELQEELVRIQEQKERKELEKRLCEEGRDQVERIRSYMKRDLEGDETEKNERSFLEIQEHERRNQRIRSGKFGISDIIVQKLLDKTKFTQPPYKILKQFETIDEFTFLEQEINRTKFLLSMQTINRFLNPFVFLLNRRKEKLEIQKVLEERQDAVFRGRDEDEGIHNSVQGDIKKTLVGKKHFELERMERDIQHRLNTPGHSNSDPEYWQSLLKIVKVLKAKASINEYNETQRPEEKEIEEELSLDEIFTNKVNGVEDNPLTEEEIRKKQEEERFFKVISHFVGIDDKDHVEEVECTTRFNENYKDTLVKPLFFNKIFFGYEWTKYNRVHYNERNLPPRTVQKYRFNIFYPEVDSDKSQPRFWFDKNRTTEEHTVLVFHIGEPYMDVAFQIINREWEMAERKGYKSNFENGIFQLYFSMKRKSRRRRFNTR